jgi:hypothetical protein
MNRQKNRTVCTILMGVLLTLAPAAVNGAEPARTAPPSAAEVAKLAKEARTPADHAEVAKKYELRAKALEQKADKVEREIQRERATPPSVMETRWPAMVANARERREQLAMQNRRAAEECFRLAAHHRTLAGDTAASE